MPEFIRGLSPDELATFRGVERQTIKLKSVVDRLFFLNECEVFGVVPKCVRLKRTFTITVPLSTDEFAKKAITENIINAKSKRKELEVLIDKEKQRLYSSLSNELKTEIDDYLSSILTKVNGRLLNKISRLFEETHKCKNFINASSYDFTEIEIGILSMGPKHVFREDFQVCDIVSFFEKASWVLSKAEANDALSSSSLEKLKQQHIKENGYNKSSRVLKNLIKKLKSLPIVITKADKECKLVALNKVDYINGLMKVLGDSSKFSKYQAPPRGRGRPSKMNVFEQKTKEVNEFVESVENLSDHIKCELVTRQPFLYGLAKTHKNKSPIPLRPVLSATGCYNFALAKFITGLISPFCYSSCCVQNADEFKERLVNFRSDLPPNTEITEVSYDVESLFTNIPLDDTIDKLVSKIFKNSSIYKYKNVIFTKDTLKEALCLCAKDQLFLFNNEIWLQTDGNSMGSPLGPPLANFYVSYIEEECIDFDSNISPDFYTRYVDDVFCVFINSDKSDSFLDHLNQVSVPLKFTIEKMSENKLNYIGLTISNDLYVSIIDKSPYYNFSSPSSHVPSQYLYAGINCLAFRALSYVDKDFNLQKEFDKIRTSASKASLSKSKVNNILIDKQKSFANKSDNSNCDNVVNVEGSGSDRYVHCCPILTASNTDCPLNVTTSES